MLLVGRMGIPLLRKDCREDFGEVEDEVFDFTLVVKVLPGNGHVH